MAKSTAEPAAILSDLPRADGSATYSHGGYTITASANGPIEAQRRDEDPYEALVDVVVRPEAGVGGTRERHLESLLQSSLRQLILVKKFPRCLFQLVLQVKASPQNDYVNTKLVKASLNLAILPALLQTAVLALLSAAVPLRATATATAVAIIVADGAAAKKLIPDPSPSDVDKAQSLHVFAFTSHDELLLTESEGDFNLPDWERAHAAALKICCEPEGKPGDAMLVDDEESPAGRRGPDLRHFLRSTMETKIAADLQWKGGQ